MTAVTEADAAGAQGVGGSGAARVERHETVDSVLRDAGVTGRQMSYDDVRTAADLSDSFRQWGDTPMSIDDASVVTRDFSAAETKQILGSAVADLSSRSAIGAMWKIAWETAGNLWDWRDSSDTFVIGNMVLDGGKFGNYFAAYVSTARLGVWGLEGAWLGGEWYNFTEHVGGNRATPTIFDPPSDQQLIYNGAMDAVRDVRGGSW